MALDASFLVKEGERSMLRTQDLKIRLQRRNLIPRDMIKPDYIRLAQSVYSPQNLKRTFDLLKTDKKVT